MGDTHIGASNFKLDQRHKDFLRVFEEAIDICIDLKVDFVIHSGDLFDTGRPSFKELIFVIEQLKKLKENNIPFLTVAGSHDVYIHETPLSLLEKIGLLTNLSNPRYLVPKGDVVLLNGASIKNTFIAGVPGFKGNVKEKYSMIKPNIPNNVFSIFIFHHIISDVEDAGSFADLPLSSLPKGFDYYAGGHWHRKNIFEYNKKPVVYPGSTEYTDSLDMLKSKEKGMFLVEVPEEKTKKLKLKWIKLNAREVVFKEIELNNLTPIEATNKLFKEIPKHGRDSILILKLKGRINGLKSQINFNRVLKESEINGFIYCKLFLSELSDEAGEEYQEIKNKTIKEIEYEFLKKQKYDDVTIKLAQELINLLGKEQTPKELILNQEECIKMIDKLFLNKELNDFMKSKEGVK